MELRIFSEFSSPDLFVLAMGGVSRLVFRSRWQAEVCEALSGAMMCSDEGLGRRAGAWFGLCCGDGCLDDICYCRNGQESSK